MKSNPLRLFLLTLSLAMIFTLASTPPLMGQFAARNPDLVFSTGSGVNPIPSVDPELALQLARDETRGYLIYFRQKADLSPAYQLDWEARGWFVMETLQDVAETSQKRVRTYLDQHGIDYQAFWIDNVIAVKRSNLPAFNGLLAFTEIKSLQAEPQVFLLEPETVQVQENVLLGVEPNITHVQAPAAWDLGFNGTGITVASIDTGVRYTHQALVNQYRGNLGGGVFEHNYNWWDPYKISSLPSDENGHGTHTVGIMVGDDGGSNQIGMAPGANWISCRGCNSTSCGGAELYECGQFMAAPWNLTRTNPNPNLRPHVVNNSWGDCDQTYDPWYQGVVDNWHAAGIYPVFANGNAGNCGYPAPPGLETVVNPARYSNVTGVGSTGKSDGQYASHSAWGPTDNPDTVNPHGFPTIKPQVVAPGAGIRSSYKGNDGAYTLMTGTSMSSPHVAGLVALMWQAVPDLIGDYSTTETILQNTASPIPYDTGNGDEGLGFVPNHATGWGEINALAAVSGSGYLLTEPRYLEVTLGPDTTLTHPLVIKNLSSWDIDFQISILGSGLSLDGTHASADPDLLLLKESNSLSWIQFDPVTGTIDAMSTQPVQVTFDAGVPEGLYQATLFIQNITDNIILEIDVTFTVLSEAQHGLSLQPSNASQFGNPGQTVTHSLTLTNTGNVTDIISVNTSNNNWPVNISASTILLNPGRNSNFSVYVDIPVGSVPGDNDTVTISSISSSDNSIKPSSKLTTINQHRRIFLPLALNP